MANYEIDGGQIYYFLCRMDGKYHTLFVGFLRPELVHAFTELKEGYQAHIRIELGEHTFDSVVDCPLYVLKYGTDEALEFAGDDRELELCPSGTPPDTILPPVVAFPTYWTAGVEPMLAFKLGGGFFAQESGEWVPLNVGGSTGPL